MWFSWEYVGTSRTRVPVIVVGGATGGVSVSGTAEAIAPTRSTDGLTVLPAGRSRATLIR